MHDVEVVATMVALEFGDINCLKIRVIISLYLRDWNSFRPGEN